MIVSVVVLVVIALMIWLVVSARLSVTAMAAHVATSPGTVGLFERYFDRSRRFRTAGAVAGCLVAALTAVILSIENDQSRGSGLDLLVVMSVALAGSVIGSVLAEAFRMRRPRGPRVVSLEVRDPAQYRDPISDRRERVTAALATIAAGVGLAAGEPAVVALGLVVWACVATRRWATARIALRARPALPPAVAEADDSIRRLATSSGLGRPMVTLQLLTVCWQLRLLAWNHALFGLASSATFWVAAMWWWDNRSFGLITSAGLRPDHRVRRLALGFGLMGALVAATFVVRAL
ncbi:MAG: hypothetical protein R2695_19210 [Acidimicrobiales bacterium]